MIPYYLKFLFYIYQSTALDFLFIFSFYFEKFQSYKNAKTIVHLYISTTLRFKLISVHSVK